MKRLSILVVAALALSACTPLPRPSPEQIERTARAAVIAAEVARIHARSVQ